MEEREKRLIGEELEPGGRPKAPGRLELLQRFVNTHNHDFPDDWDRIGTPEKATDWLRAKGLIAPDERVTDVERLHALREAIRALLVDPRPDAFAALARGAHLTVVVDADGRTALRARARARHARAAAPGRGRRSRPAPHAPSPAPPPAPPSRGPRGRPRRRRRGPAAPGGRRRQHAKHPHPEHPPSNPQPPV